jgi:hypothetical protein
VIKLIVPFESETVLSGGVEHANSNVLVSKNAIKAVLSISYEHPRSSYGAGVVLNCDNEIFDGVAFRWLRDHYGAWIEAEDVTKVCHALGVPDGELGIISL